MVRTWFDEELQSMSDEVRIDSLRLKFLIDDADNGGKLAMFEMTVPEQAKVPAAHYPILSLCTAELTKALPQPDQFLTHSSRVAPVATTQRHADGPVYSVFEVL
jgi:hypothetical protein